MTKTKSLTQNCITLLRHLLLSKMDDEMICALLFANSSHHTHTHLVPTCLDS